MVPNLNAKKVKITKPKVLNQSKYNMAAVNAALAMKH